MKSLRKFLSTLLSLSLVFASLGAGAASAASEEAAPEHVTINPDSLRDLLLKRNLSIRLELDNLYTAKANVNAASAGLLPSLTLGVGVTNPITFALKTISFLVPFLLPSNWLNLREKQGQLKAEGLGYYAVKLNNLASVDSVYYTVVGDLEAQAVLNRQAKVLEDIYQLVSAKYKLGLATQADIAQANNSRKTSRALARQSDAAVANELEAIKLYLALEPSTTIDVEVKHEDPSDSESKTAQEIADLTVKTSPEYRQLTLLHDAAVAHMRSVEYSFFNAFTMGSTGGAGSSASFSNLTTGIGLNLSFTTIANVQLSEIAKEQILDQQKSVAAGQKYSVGTTLVGLSAALDQYQDYLDAESSAQALYDVLIVKYKAGLTDLLHVFSATQNITTAAASRIQAGINVDTQRVALKRILRSDDFAKIDQCDLSRAGEVHGNLFKHMGSIFSSPKISIDQACAAMAKANLPASAN